MSLSSLAFIPTRPKQVVDLTVGDNIAVKVGDRRIFPAITRIDDRPAGLNVVGNARVVWFLGGPHVLPSSLDVTVLDLSAEDSDSAELAVTAGAA
jgi:hypothetical protein